jgi:PAS domain S-box-containing protein
MNLSALPSSDPSSTLSSEFQPPQILQCLWEAVSYGIYVLDVLENYLHDGDEFRFAACNPAFARTSPIPVERLLYQTLGEALPSEQASNHRQHYRHCVKLGQTVTFEESFKFKGKDTWWLLTVNPLFSENQVSQLLVTAIDISDRAKLDRDRQVAEAALVESESKFRRLIEDAEDILAVWGLDGNLTYLSPSFQTQLGFVPGEWLGKSFEALVHPEDLENCWKANQEVIETSKPRSNIKFRHRHQDGRWIWMSINVSPIKDEKGQVTAFQGILRSIDEAKRLEQQILAQQARFESFFDGSTVGLAMLDEHLRFVQLNNALAEMHGLPAAAHLGKSVGEILPDLAPMLIPAMQDILKTGVPCLAHEVVGEIPGQPGILHAWLASYYPLRDEHCQICGLCCVVINIDDRKNAEAELQLREQQIRSINNYVPGMIYQYQTNLQTGEITLNYLSPGAAELYEMPIEIMQANPTLSWSMICPEDLEHMQASVEQSVQNAAPWFDEFRIITPSGRTKWIRGQSEAAEAPAGFSIHNGVMIDITDRKAAEATLQQYADCLEQTLEELRRTQTQVIQSEKMSSLGQLVAGIAHEINNPVNFIHGNLSHMHQYTQEMLELIELYQQTYPNSTTAIATKIAEIDLEFLNQDLKNILTSMQSGTERIREIVKSLRLFSRLDEAEVKSVNIHDGIDSALMILDSRLKGSVDGSDIQVIKKYGALPEIECFAGQLNQVFMNILLNAIDALDHQPKSDRSICIITEIIEGNDVAIRIKDNGCGIEESLRPQVFDPFFTTKPVGKGTGMGMSIAYQIITETHKGTLSFQSVLGEGTEFVVQIPIAHTT